MPSLWDGGTPDNYNITVYDLIAEGDRVVWRFTARGTQTGELLGMPPSRKTMEIGGIVISRFAGDKWVEDWGSWDINGMLQQLGAAPAPATSAA